MIFFFSSGIIVCKIICNTKVGLFLTRPLHRASYATFPRRLRPVLRIVELPGALEEACKWIRAVVLLQPILQEI